ncbi:MAG TPA: response regulator transcription factor [Candidatus Methylomirabilis sp.]|nr:response regulator transcription factor [Candidatus Methylomirabilis sp.]
MKPIRILLADDHGMVRAGIRALIENIPGVQVVSETDDGIETLRMIKAHRPDVALVDIVMPGLNGLEVARRVAMELPDVRVIILSMYDNEEYVLQALHAGAVGYLLKGGSPSELGLAIHAVVRGETFLSSAVAKDVVNAYLRGFSSETDPSEILKLTPQQQEVLKLIAQDLETEEIAQQLHISLEAVETEQMLLMERLNIYEMAGLTKYAHRVGLAPPES